VIRCSEPIEINYISKPSIFSWIRYFTPSSISPAFIINSAETYVCNDNNVINFDSDLHFGLVYIGQKSPEGYKAGGRNCGSSYSRHSTHSRDLILFLYNRMWQRRILWLRDRIKECVQRYIRLNIYFRFSLYNPLILGGKNGWYFCLTDNIYLFYIAKIY